MNRESRLSKNPVVYYGLIISGDQVMRYGATKDRLRRELDIFYFKIKAAGLMDKYSCFIIRGIYDYADSHKNKR